MNSIYATVLAAAATVVTSQSVSPVVLRSCPSSNICYSLSIPSSTAQSGSGPIFFQIQAPASSAWAALGQGTQMAGANMFVMYSNADGSNVTLSPRTAPGNVMPKLDSSLQVELLEGSGIANNVMTANVRCDNCTTWSGGALDYTGSSSDWLYAVNTGSAVRSNDQSAVISQHQAHGEFDFATQQAIGGDSTNPFLAKSSTGDASPSSSSSSPSSPSSSSSSGGDITQPVGQSSGYSALSASTQDTMVTAHGTLSSIAFVALFPLGALLMRVGSFGRRLVIHGAIQVLAYAVFIAGAGLGIYIAMGTQQLNNPHPIIGLFLLAFVFFMPFTGYYHHALFKRNGKRTFVGIMHANAGRIAILLGIINGGLGLQLSGAERSAIIAYSVIAGVVGVAYLAMVAWWEVAGSKKGSGAVSEKGTGSIDRH